MITVCTPAYNRADRLPYLYHSLCAQSCRDFEWLVVDDGSTDGTRTLIDTYISENIIDIRYIRKTNGGKHTAINTGVSHARGQWTFIVDSDDRLTADAIAWICEKTAEVYGLPHIAGISGFRCHESGEIIGGNRDFGHIDANALDIRTIHGVRGDQAEVFRTAVLRQYPFPEIPDERFCPEALVWHRIARQYSLRYYSHPIYICEYLPDGLTDHIISARRHSPLASITYYSELLHHTLPLMLKIKTYLNLWRFTPPRLFKTSISNTSAISLLFLIPGWLIRLTESGK